MRPDASDPPSPPAVVRRFATAAAAVALAEIYRKYRHDSRRAEALVGRARAKYPDAPELQGADRLA